MEMKEFKSANEYHKYLKEQFKKISQVGEFNVFMHCVTAHTPYFSSRNDNKEEEIKKKVEGIINKGLDLDGSNSYGRYGSIRCTTNFGGAIINDEVLDKISKYDYLSHSRYVHTIILLIPKYIKIDDENVEFSSLNGEMKGRSQHDKTCLFDAVKDHYSPTEFTFGYQVYDTQTKTYKFHKNEHHFAFLDENRKKEIEGCFAEKIKQAKRYCKEKYNVEKTEDILTKMTEEHMEIINDFLMDP